MEQECKSELQRIARVFQTISSGMLILLRPFFFTFLISLIIYDFMKLLPLTPAPKFLPQEIST
jgi:hypothetical protein